MTHRPADRHRTLLTCRCLCSDISVRYGTHVLVVRVAQSPRRKPHSTLPSWSDEFRTHRKQVIMPRSGDTTLQAPTDVGQVGHVSTTWSKSRQTSVRRFLNDSRCFVTRLCVAENKTVWSRSAWSLLLHGRMFMPGCADECLLWRLALDTWHQLEKQSNPLPD